MSILGPIIFGGLVVVAGLLALFVAVMWYGIIVGVPRMERREQVERDRWRGGI